MRYVGSKELKAGMIISSNLYDANEKILVKANTQLTQYIIDRLQRMEFDGVYVFEKGDVEAARSIISDETRMKAINKLKKLDINACMFLANSIVNEIQSSESLLIEQTSLSSYDSYTYVHSVNVDVLSVVTGIGLGLKNDELERLSQSALLHDIGKCDVPLEILNKPAKLTKEEYEEMKKHPEYGLKRLREKDGDDVAAVVKNAVYSHHENWNGTGYPRGMKGEEIHKFARIIHVADVYDALTSQRPYKDSLNPSDALEYLMANSGEMFDIDVVNTFLKYVAPYPIGCTVLMSSGQQGTVIENDENHLSRPKVKLANGTKIDMMKKLDVTILKILS